MAILNAENLSLLSGTSWKLIGLDVSGTAGTPTKFEQINFGAVSTLEGIIKIVADKTIVGTFYQGGKFKALIGPDFELLNLQYDYFGASLKMVSLDLDGDTLIIKYNELLTETYTNVP